MYRSMTSAKDEGHWKDVMQQWMWLKALWSDSYFYGAVSLTSDLVKLKYIMQQAMLLQVFIKQVGSEKGLIHGEAAYMHAESWDITVQYGDRAVAICIIAGVVKSEGPS
ncbi:hypothetical protein HD554DRAFT_2039912 [Boletus coccyginus]|nr:hypothetical protein HD554DRAFT_2039912 [Boletus coccyginus]